MRPKISAVVCTRNRALLLQKTVQNLIDQTLSKQAYEIIIVDNASGDETRKVVQEFLDHENIRYIYEPSIGLSRARNTGWKNAAGTYIAYLDDDAAARSEWLAKMLAAFETLTPTPVCVGGKVELILETQKPLWLSDELLFCIGKLNLSKEPLILNGTDYLIHGCNMAVERSALVALGGFREELGRKGSTLLSGEDVFLQYELKRTGKTCFYLPDAIIDHYIPTERLTKRWFLKRMFWEGVTRARMELSSDTISWTKRLSLAKREWSMLWNEGRITNLIMSSKRPRSFDEKCWTVERLGYAGMHFCLRE